LRILKSITFHYDPKHDRILAVVNPGHADSWSCWLTRRLTLALLDRSTEFLTSSSDLAKRVAADSRGEIAAFEREAAIAKTATAMSNTPPDVLKAGAAAATLIERLTFAHRGASFRAELRDEAGDGADGALTREEFQRILQMLQVEVAKSGWTAAPATTAAAPAAEPAAPKPFRH
jgi:hypothetical protein